MASQRLVRVGVNAGEYDPVPMQFYAPRRTQVNSEPKTVYARTIQLHIRVMAGITREVRMNGRQENVSVSVFRIRRDVQTEIMDHTFMAKWRGKVYNLTGDPNPVSLEELEIYCTRSDVVLE